MGVKTASCYDPVTGEWSAAPDMNAGRWYPTNTTLANGEVLVTSGSVDTKFHKNTLPQVWQPDEGACGSWRDLTGANQVEPLGAELYPWMFLAPDGKVFKAGPDDKTWSLPTAGTGAWTPGPPSSFGLRSYGSAVLYDAGKILIVGGSKLVAGAVPAPTATAETIDLTAGSPGWMSAGSMAFPRRQLDATVLPDDTVLVTGGTSGAGFDNETTPVLPAELWDPSDGSWKVMSSMTVPRMYHSTAVLLPDGRVLVAGGEGAGARQQQHEMEIYSPPYLFKGPRPTISSAPSETGYGTSFFVGTDQPQAIARMSLMRLPSVTHDFDQNARFLPLDFAPAPGGVTVTAPARPEIAPPGH